MCCTFASFIVKFVLITANILFALAGLVIIGLGVAVHIQIRAIQDLIPVNLNAISTVIIVVGCVIFVISCLACCGARKGSRCMLLFYAAFMVILAGIKIYLVVIIFNFLNNTISTVSRWLNSAFYNDNLRPAYHVMENIFDCCGTSGSTSYTAQGEEIPPSCCDSHFLNCTTQNSHSGCTTQVGNYLETFGEAIGGVLITVIIIEFVCVIFASFLTCRIKGKQKVYV